MLSWLRTFQKKNPCLLPEKALTIKGFAYIWCIFKPEKSNHLSLKPILEETGWALEMVKFSFCGKNSQRQRCLKDNSKFRRTLQGISSRKNTASFARNFLCEVGEKKCQVFRKLFYVIPSRGWVIRILIGFSNDYSRDFISTEKKVKRINIFKY